MIWPRKGRQCGDGAFPDATGARYPAARPARAVTSAVTDATPVLSPGRDPADGKYHPTGKYLLNNVHPPKPRTDLTNDRIHFC